MAVVTSVPQDHPRATEGKTVGSASNKSFSEIVIDTIDQSLDILQDLNAAVCYILSTSARHGVVGEYHLTDITDSQQPRALLQRVQSPRLHHKSLRVLRFHRAKTFIRPRNILCC
jgi:hypothetical protein